MKRSLWASLLVFALLPSSPVMAQWGNFDHQEKADVLGRDLAYLGFVDEHDGIFKEYTTGNPDDRNNSNLIEMQGPPTNAIVTESVQNFINASKFRGAFGYPTTVLSRTQRVAIVTTIEAMKNRVPAIDYVESPYINKYLSYTNRDGSPTLSLGDIDRMRSDAVVEFAYTSNGFPIFRPSPFNTIVNNPYLFSIMASSYSVRPSYQLYAMIGAIVEAPELTVYSAGVPLTNGAAISTPSITVYVSDYLSGPGRLEVWLGAAQTGSLVAVNNDDVNGVDKTYTSADSGLSGIASLADGQYTVRAIDQAGNHASVKLTIRTSAPSSGNKDKDGNSLPGVFPSTYCVAGHASDPSGIASITVSASGFSDTTNFDCTPGRRSTDAIGHLLCGLPTGNYTTTSVNCANIPSSSTSTITTGTNTGVACLAGTCRDFTPTSASSTTIVVNTVGPCGGCNYLDFCERAELNPRTSCPDLGGFPAIQNYNAPCPQSLSFSIVNTTTTTWQTALQVTAGAGGTAFFNDVAPPAGNSLLSGSITIPQTNALCPVSNSPNTAIVVSSYPDLRPTLIDLLEFLLEAAIRQIRAYVPGSANGVFGSDVILTSSGTLTFSMPNPSTIDVSTSSLAIYRFDGVDWTSAAVTNQSVSKHPVTSVISATGSIITSGYYALFFDGTDSSAPVTTFSFQGSSFSFDGTLFVSTDAFIVLTATDPLVNGYASTVSSITYRLDPSSGSPFGIYSSSIPLPLGTHVFEYRSQDFAGNFEAVRTTTFTVTAGTAFRTANTAQVPGMLLNGFLGSGAKLEIESRAENSLTLMISSVNRQAMVSVDNIGEVGIGVTPRANLNIGAGAIGLQLRSGNSTSSVTSNQIAFGYNGDYSMRHLLRTEHSTATHGNKMDFLVWNTGAASTTAVAGLNVLSLQGIAAASNGSFHVQPVGEPDAEVEVSNGLTTGGGTMQRLQVVAPSSRRFKTDIKDLSEQDEERALADVAGLKHAMFRYKSRQKSGSLIEDPAQALHTGLIYEEAPESIREGGEALSTSERLVNVELALKASMRRLEELQRRYEKLKARKSP